MAFPAEAEILDQQGSRNMELETQSSAETEPVTYWPDGCPQAAAGQQPQNAIIKPGPGWPPKVPVEAAQGWLRGVEGGGRKWGKKAKILSK